MYNIYESIDSVEQVKESDIILYAVSKLEVENKDLQRLSNNLEILKQAGKDAKGKLFLTFDGYDNDEREVYMIPEIRSFVKTIWKKYKYLFYFLTAIENNRSIIFACINDFKACQNKDNKKCYLEIIYNDEIKKQTIDAMIKHGIIINDIEGVQRVLFTFI